ncbi:UNVERIFIED_CONTAM: hypothetical protein K2H54_003917 [Gekko kuhli]
MVCVAQLYDSMKYRQTLCCILWSTFVCMDEETGLDLLHTLPLETPMEQESKSAKRKRVIHFSPQKNSKIPMLANNSGDLHLEGGWNWKTQPRKTNSMTKN